jgi:hypothetical protein
MAATKHDKQTMLIAEFDVSPLLSLALALAALALFPSLESAVTLSHRASPMS